MADKDEGTAELSLRVPIQDVGRLHYVGERVFGISATMLARILVHQGLENFRDVFARLGTAAAEAKERYDVEHPPVYSEPPAPRKRKQQPKKPPQKL